MQPPGHPCIPCRAHGSSTTFPRQACQIPWNLKPAHSMLATCRVLTGVAGRKGASIPQAQLAVYAARGHYGQDGAELHGLYGVCVPCMCRTACVTALHAAVAEYARHPIHVILSWLAAQEQAHWEHCLAPSETACSCRTLAGSATECMQDVVAAGPCKSLHACNLHAPLECGVAPGASWPHACADAEARVTRGACGRWIARGKACKALAPGFARHWWTHPTPQRSPQMQRKLQLKAAAHGGCRRWHGPDQSTHRGGRPGCGQRQDC